jgi:hypothetical protein
MLYILRLDINNFNNNVQKKKDNRTHTTQKAKYPATWIPLKTGCEVISFGRVRSSCSICGTRRALIQIFKEISYLLIILIIAFTQKQKSLSCDNHIGFRSEYHAQICLCVSNMHTPTFLTFEMSCVLLSSCLNI